MKTVRNPPDDVLATECERGYLVTDRLRQTLPNAEISTEVERKGESHLIRFTVENRGYLSTMGLDIAGELPGTPSMSVHLKDCPNVHTVVGQTTQTMPHLGGWGLQGSSGANSIYPSLSARSHRQHVEFEVQGTGTVTLEYTLGRGGCGQLNIELD